MLLVAKKRSRITGLPKVIAVITFHVERDAAQVAALDERSHASRHVAELIVMSCRQLKPLLIGECNKYLGLLCVECDWLLDIDVASALKAQSGKIEMTFRRRGDVDHVGPRVVQDVNQLRKVPLEPEPFAKLTGHQRLRVTDANDLAPFDPLDLRRVRIRDLAASHDGNFKHVAPSPGSFGNNGSIPPPSAPWLSSPAAPSL